MAELHKQVMRELESVPEVVLDEIKRLNIEQTECYFQLEAKTCGCNENRTIAYSVVDSFHGLCIGKNDILRGQIEACERSLSHTNSMADRIALLGEIAHLRLNA